MRGLSGGQNLELMGSLLTLPDDRARVRTMRARRLGATAVIIGGVLDVARVIVTQLVFPSVAAPRIVVAAVALAPMLLIAVGAVAVALSYRARGRLAFLLAGISGLLVVAVNAAQILLESLWGPAPSQLAIAVNGASVIAGAVILLTDRTVRTPDRWSLALPAGCMLLVVPGMTVLPWAALAALPAVGYVFGGILVLRTTNHPPGRRWRRQPNSREGIKSY